jgi:spermidine/putrescine transport system substrate-binding protein
MGNTVDHELLAGIRPSRRRFATTLAAAGLTLTVLPLTIRRSGAAVQPIYYTWDGYDDPGFFPSYVAKRGEPPIMQTFVDENDALGQLKDGLPADVVHPCNGNIERWRQAGMLQPIDVSRLSNWSDVLEPLRTIPGTTADGQQWFIPIDWGVTSVVYRSDLVENREESLALLWDERYAGRLSVGEDASDTVTIAGIYAGARDPFDMTDDELARVRDLLMQQKRLIRFYWVDSTTMEEAMASGEIVASTAWPNSVLNLKRKGVPVEYMNLKEGMISYSCGVVLAKAATEIDAAYDLIDAMLTPEAGEWLLNTHGYGHSNRKTYERVDPQLLVDLGMPRDITQMLTHGHFTREFKRMELMQQIFDDVRAAS